MLVNVRDRVPSTEYPRTASDNKHRRSAAELLSLAYSGNETVTSVPATENAVQKHRVSGRFSVNGKNQGSKKDPRCSQRQVGQSQVHSTDCRSWRSHPESIGLTSRSFNSLSSALTQQSPIAHQCTQSLFVSKLEALDLDL